MTAIQNGHEIFFSSETNIHCIVTYALANLSYTKHCVYISTEELIRGFKYV